MEQKGVGVVGLGVAALYAHLPALAGSDELQLLAACDRDPAKFAHVRERWPLRNFSTDIDEFLATAGLQAVIVATPPDSHYEIARAAISRGKHVLSEKPLARTVNECKALAEMAARNNVCLLVGHEKRFHPTLEKIRTLLGAGEIGKPYYCAVHWASNAKMDPDHLVPDGFRQGYEWRWQNPAVGGGIVQDHQQCILRPTMWLGIGWDGALRTLCGRIWDWSSCDSQMDSLCVSRQARWGAVCLRFGLKVPGSGSGRSTDTFWARKASFYLTYCPGIRRRTEESLSGG